MADHKIKSKSKSRWNHSSVLSRCSNPEDGQLSGHFLKGNTWEYLPLQNFTLDDEKISTIISTAQINHPYLLLEVSFEKQSGILAPKVTCYRLCDSTVLGKTVSTPIGSSRTDPTLDPQQPSKLFPTQRLQITSKGLTEACKEKILLLVNLLESRSKQKIQKISCVFVVEDYKNCATHPEYKIKLHHTNEIQFSQKKSSTSGASSSLRLLNNRSSAGFLPSSVSHQSISESGYSECVSEITTSARGYLHKFKCEGDFCLFNSEEEGMQLQLSEELEFNINRERKHAIQRNRSAEEIDGRGGEDDDDDDVYRSNILAATSTQSSHNHSGGATGGGPGGASNGTQAYKISVKSIFLARNEMKLLDARLQNSSGDISSPPKEKNLPPELRHWSSLLLSWYCRIGRSVIQKYAQPAVPIPVSSGHHISKALLRGQGSSGDCEDAIESREFDDETHMTTEKTKLSKNSKNKTVNLSSSTLKQFTSTSAASGSVSLAMASPSRDQDQLSQLIPYDLQENSYHPQHHNETSAKHLGRYYSSSLVCERCYYVYKELNRLRNIEFQNTLRTKKREEVEEKIALREENNSRYLSQRMEQMNNFANQRIATYRLSKSKHSSAGEEMCGEGDREYPQRLGAGGGGGGGYSLPPLPWQLSHDERKRQEYQQQGSAFVRNIQSKTQQILELTAQKNQDFFSGRGGAGAGEDNELDPNFDWKKTLLSQYGAGAGTSGRSDPNTSSRRRGGGGGELMKSGSAGSGSGMGKGRGAGGGRKGKEKKKSFDHERLLHPYQRYLEQMKREEREERLGRGEGRGEGREAIERTHQPHLQQQHQQREQHRHQQQQTQSSNPQNSHSQSHSQSQSQSGGFGRSGKSFSLSLLPVLEHEQEEGQGSPQKSQSMTTLPPLVPRARHQPSQQPSTTAFSSSSSPQKSSSKPLPTRALSSGEDSDGDDEEDEDDGIGWSPFVVT